jgi:hypothetical protein
MTPKARAAPQSRLSLSKPPSPIASYHVYTECLIRKHVNHLLRLYFSSQDGTVATLDHTGVPAGCAIAAHLEAMLVVRLR